LNAAAARVREFYFVILKNIKEDNFLEACLSFLLLIYFFKIDLNTFIGVITLRMQMLLSAQLLRQSNRLAHTTNKGSEIIGSCLTLQRMNQN
jgi:hypothetical protein